MNVIIEEYKKNLLSLRGELEDAIRDNEQQLSNVNEALAAFERIEE